VCQRFVYSLLLTFLFYCDKYKIGQTTQSSSYTCNQNNSTIEFSLFSSFHSAWNSTSNCSLIQCAANNYYCRLSQTPCFNYLTINNISYCAPASLCSILAPCNNITNTCSSNTSVCIVNSCCSPKTVCLPLLWTTFCPMTSQFFIMNDCFSMTIKNCSDNNNNADTNIIRYFQCEQN
jgi:hypothetical protein